VAADQEPIDVDEVESIDEPRSKTEQEGICRRLRSRTPKPTPTAVVTPAVTKKAKDTFLKPVKYGPSRKWCKPTSPPEKKKPLKRKSAPPSDSDYDAE
ncbi:hypothetical protein A2U01_0073711, partial [Trifolium medium]|nr:hypothetical protein [Trifolium medium]